MAENKKEINADFKAALEQKELEKARLKREAAVREMRRQEEQKQNRATMRRELEEQKRKREIELAIAETSRCEEDIKKAKEILENEFYDTITKISFVIIVLIIVITIALAVAGYGRNALLMMMALEFVAISISIYFQSVPISAEKLLHDSSKKLKEAKNTLSKNKGR